MLSARGWVTAGAVGLAVAGLVVLFGYWGGYRASRQVDDRLALAFPVFSRLSEADRAGIVIASIKCKLNEVGMADGRPAVVACLRRGVSEGFRERLEHLLLEANQAAAI